MLTVTKITMNMRIYAPTSQRKSRLDYCDGAFTLRTGLINTKKAELATLGGFKCFLRYMLKSVYWSLKHYIQMLYSFESKHQDASGHLRRASQQDEATFSFCAISFLNVQQFVAFNKKTLLFFFFFFFKCLNAVY